jgi:hypothetical protein
MGKCYPIFSDFGIINSWRAQPYVRVVAGTTTTYYPTLQAAYDDAPDGSIMQVRDLTLTENLDINSVTPKNVSLQGGFNSDYSVGNGVTILKGSITTSTGQTIIQDFNLQQ